ncbi:hypothetical protein GUJ93_ZPchr0015g6937 [Zizania palustris]|uniref:Uncharacterized protein n=1 Tax=Zizania palustris TaxID=103762 RepID=A0A8J5VSV7_ZIZPA|nr:hypothetical protein GUJ93_ZPchr0015g6937 [Zizania palustris]
MAVYRRVLLRFSHLYPQFQPASELSSQASTPPHLSPSSPLLSPSRLFAFCSADRRSLRVESPARLHPFWFGTRGYLQSLLESPVVFNGWCHINWTSSHFSWPVQ